MPQTRQQRRAAERAAAKKSGELWRMRQKMMARAVAGRIETVEQLEEMLAKLPDQEQRDATRAALAPYLKFDDARALIA